MRDVKFSFISRYKAPANRRLENGPLPASCDAAAESQTNDRTARLRLMIECEIIPRLMMAHAHDEPEDPDLSASNVRRHLNDLSKAVNQDTPLSQDEAELVRSLTGEANEALAENRSSDGVACGDEPSVRLRIN
jgi:hypothetical protein